MKKNKTIKFHVRQGDVLIRPIDSIPSGLRRTKCVTLAYGEATGHHHSIKSGAIGYAEEETALCSYLEVAEALALLEHQEHSPIAIPPGKYEVIHQFEYTPQEIRRVAD